MEVGISRKALGKFQFPSNGKGFPNEKMRFFAAFFLVRFNSLQTGKAFRTEMKRLIVTVMMVVFQFPSNGKGFPNTRGEAYFREKYS